MRRGNSKIAPIPDDIAQLRRDPAAAVTSAHAKQPGRRLAIQNLRDVEEKTVEAVWGGRLLKHKINNLQGATGLGKTLIALDIAARWTVGEAFPGEAVRREPGTVLMLSAEDGVGDTLKPRIRAAGGEESRVLVSSTTVTSNEAGGDVHGRLSLKDAEEIESALRDNGVSLLIVDPVTSFLGPRVDMNKANEVRPILERLTRTASDLGVTVLLIYHVGKSTVGPSQPAYRALGSVDFVNVARSVLTVAERDGKRYLAHAKINLRARAPTLEYSIDATRSVPETDQAPHIVWGATSDLTADDLFAQTGHSGARTKYSESQVEDLIKQALETPQLSADLKMHVCSYHGVPKHQYEQVRANLKRSGQIENFRPEYQAPVIWRRSAEDSPDATEAGGEE